MNNDINEMTREERLLSFPEKDPSISREKLYVKKHCDSRVIEILKELIEFSQLIPSYKSKLKLVEYPNKILLVQEYEESCVVLVEYDLIASAFLCTGEERILNMSLRTDASFVISAFEKQKKIELAENEAVAKSSFSKENNSKLWYPLRLLLRVLNKPVVHEPDLIFTQEQYSLAKKILQSTDYGYYCFPNVEHDPKIILALLFGFVQTQVRSPTLYFKALQLEKLTLDFSEVIVVKDCTVLMEEDFASLANALASKQQQRN